MRGYVYLRNTDVIRIFGGSVWKLFTSNGTIFTRWTFEEISFAPNVFWSDFTREVLLVTGSLHFQPRNANDSLSQRRRGDLFTYSLVTARKIYYLVNFHSICTRGINTPSVGEKKITKYRDFINYQSESTQDERNVSCCALIKGATNNSNNK